MDTPLPFPGLKFIPLSGWFFFTGSADSQACHTAISDMLMLCHALQAPLKPEKVVHPTNCITFVGIELDTVLQQARLSTGKLTLLLRELKAFSTMHHEQHTCTKRQLLSLIGRLAFACKVIPAGRIFLRRLLDLAHSVGELDHHLQIHSEASQDILWWLSFAESCSFFPRTIVDHCQWLAPVYRRLLCCRLWRILEWSMARSALATKPRPLFRWVERALRNCDCVRDVGFTLVSKADTISLRQLSHRAHLGDWPVTQCSSHALGPCTVLCCCYT